MAVEQYRQRLAADAQADRSLGDRQPQRLDAHVAEQHPEVFAQLV